MSKLKIVMIEDEDTLSSAFTSRAQKEGWQTYTARDVDSGIKATKEVQPDLIVLDILLPGGKDGFELLEQIQTQPELQSIPVLVLTNLQNQEERARQLGAVACLVKSNTSLEEIMNLIKSYDFDNQIN